MISREPLISIVIPAFNEEASIGDLLELIKSVTLGIKGYQFELIVVNDGSTDRTHDIVGSFSGIKLLTQNNKGKGSAVQYGISTAKGDFILIQDADLEYDVNDYVVLMNALSAGLKNNTKVAIYGSRALVRAHGGRKSIRYRLKPSQGQKIGPWLANVLLSATVALLYGRWITDTLTGYKVYQRDFFIVNNISSMGFEADHEITAKLIKQGYKIIEVPISYSPRSIEEGKKIRPKDGLIALVVFLKERFRP
jgi:dolichol-phosphate mannosyltransferase